jgi:hypothetical protein
MRVNVKVVYSGGIESTGAADKPVNLIVFT